MKRINLLLKRLATDHGMLLTVESYSPGDGWTRYSIETSKEGYSLKRCLKKGECELALEAMYEALNYLKWKD